MSKRKFAGLLAGVLAVTSAGQTVLSISAETSGSYDMNISVDLKGEKKEISPLIYGINEFGNTGNVKNIKVNAVRQGGNRYTAYNWENNFSNAGEDWHNSSDTNLGDITDGPAYPVRRLSEMCEKYNIPYKMATLQMSGYAAADKAGEVKESEKAPSDRWNVVKASKGGELSMTPDLEDGAVYMDEYVNYIINTLGDSTKSTGIQGYSLDNEPVLWNDTHPLMHPEEVTNKELVSKSIELAKVVKDLDPNAEVFGPAFWGMLPCINAGESGNGWTDSEWQAVKNNYDWYLEYYLEQMAQAEKENGVRLLDVFDVHYYSQDCSTDQGRLQGARSLYDETYVENSWLQPAFGKYFPFIPNIKKSIDKYYPGTKIAVSEYNIANIADEKNTGKSVVSAIAEAETLGAFADNDVYFATYWGTLPECPYVESAINLYTNYDGKGSAFGDTLVKSGTEDLSKSFAWTAINGNDDSKVTMVVANKDMNKSENAVITIDGASTNYKSATVYAVTQDGTDIRVIDVNNNVSGNKVTVELPPLSVAQVVISDKESDEKLYEAPDLTVIEKTFAFSELEKSKNGYEMIPLGDKEHLKKIIVNATASCTSGAGWYGGGGALTFNSVVPKGETKGVWAYKSVNYSGGENNIEILFDEFFSDGKNEVEGVTTDEYAEFQDWWKSSANDETGADVSVTWNKVTLVYEYDNKTDVDIPSTTPTAPTTATTAVSTTTVTTTTTIAPADDNTVVINVADLKENATKDGLIVPLKQGAKLVKAVIELESDCKPAASWYCGGGAFTFSQLMTEGSTKGVWGAKAFQYNKGDTTLEVEFDGTFTDADQEEISAEINDKESIFQDWWKSSANSEKGEDVTVTYKTITLYYEDSEPVEPTAPTDTTAPDDDILYGDANGDGVVNVSDAVLIMGYVSNADKYPLSDKGLKCADVNNVGDGVSNMDALAIQKFAAGLLETLPEA